MASEHEVRLGDPGAGTDRYYRVTAEADEILRIESCQYNTGGKRLVWRDVKRGGAVWRRVEREFRNPTPHPAAGKAPRGVPGWRPTIAASKGDPEC